MNEKHVLERRLTSSRKYTKVPPTRICQPQISLGFYTPLVLTKKDVGSQWVEIYISGTFPVQPVALSPVSAKVRKFDLP